MPKVLEVHFPKRGIYMPWRDPRGLVGFVHDGPPFAVLDCGHRITVGFEAFAIEEQDVRCPECEHDARLVAQLLAAMVASARVPSSA